MRFSRTILTPLLVPAFLVAPLPAQSTPSVSDPLFQKARIALRLDSGQLLIVGGEIHGPYTNNALVDVTSIDKLPRSSEHAALQPGEIMYLLPPRYVSHFDFRPETRWRIGDRWSIYTGAGPAVPVVIQTLAVILYCGGIGGYAAAIAGFERTNAADSIAGLKATEYLAAPNQELKEVSGAPMMPGEPIRGLGSIPALRQLLLKHARGIVKNENWMIHPNTQKNFADRVRRMNRAFLNVSGLEPEIRSFRWSPPGRKPVLFVEALWVDQNNLPLFGCDAVVEEGTELTIISFGATRAEQMRIEEFANHEWKLDKSPAVRNAWKIGSRYFVLVSGNGYEGFTVNLMEIQAGKGMAPTSLGFGAGC